MDITLGRQRIAWGSGKVWNPSDRFQPISALSLEPQEKLGTDAAYARIQLASQGELQLVFTPSSHSRGHAQKQAVRWRDTIHETDYSFLVGKIGQEVFFAADFFSNLNEGGLFSEMMIGKPQHSSSYLQFTTGYEINIVHDWFPRGMLLGIEYFYNGAARKNIRSTDFIRSKTKQQLSLRANYSFHALWQLEALLLRDLEQQSSASFVNLNYSVTENSNILAQALVFKGNTATEFGDQKNTYALQWMYYF
jgi:hypothetical protein